MGDDDLIAGLTQSVKREVINRYLSERRILEEEINLLHEDVCSLHGGYCGWEYRTEELAGALFSARASAEIFDLAGLPRPESQPPLPGGLKKPAGLTPCGRYLNLIGGLYRLVYREAEVLEKEREAALALLREVNHDIVHFESNHDILSLTTYLRSLDLGERQRCKLLGVNFNFDEKKGLGAALAFQRVKEETLHLPPTARLTPPEKLMREAKPLLKRICRENRDRLSLLWGGK